MSKSKAEGGSISGFNDMLCKGIVSVTLFQHEPGSAKDMINPQLAVFTQPHQRRCGDCRKKKNAEYLELLKR